MVRIIFSSILCFAVMPAMATAPSSISLRFDVSAARAVLDVFEARPEDREQAIDRAMGAPGVAAMIAKTASFNPAASPAALREGLDAVASGRLTTGMPDPFSLVRVHERATETSNLLTQIETDPERIIGPVIARVARYAPPGTKLEVTIVGVLGGNSDGWATLGESSFHLALHYFGDDVDGMQLLLAHELFHLVQFDHLPPEERREEAFDTDEANGGPLAARALLRQLINEGTATLVGDAENWPGSGRYLDWFKAKFARNAQRHGENLTQLETVLFRAWHDPTAHALDLYPLLFSGGWDSNGYFVGFRMARLIERHDGPGRIAALIGQPPEHFLQRYDELARAHPGDPDAIPLSAATRRIVAELVRAGSAKS